MRLISNSDTAVRHYGPVEAVRLLARAGFDGIDWSMFDMWKDGEGWLAPDWREKALLIRETADKCGIPILQAHAPFPSSGGTKEFDDHAMACILRAMEVASILGVKNIVVHPRQQLPYQHHAQQLFDESVAMYRSLIPYCEKWNIRVCAENMWQYDKRRETIVDSICSQPEEFNALLAAADSPWIVGCLDLGHSALTGVEPADFIRAMGGRLQALHVHDVDWRHDNHDMPFNRKLDWEGICKALADIGYAGDFTFEADTWQKRFPADLLEDANVMLCKVGRYLMGRIEAYKTSI